jgi:hypothetical protein
VIVSISADGVVKIDNHDNFGRFNVKVDASSDVLGHLIEHVTGMVDFVNAYTACVKVSFLRKIYSTAEWQDGLSKIIAKAAPHG